MGEDFGRYCLFDVDQILPYISSCNIACGYHAGDPLVIKSLIQKAGAQNVRLGAHPSYPDLQGFGRRAMKIPREELKALIQYQISAVTGMATMLGHRISYVKPHGALYNEAAKNEMEAQIIIEAIQEINPELALMGLAGSVIEHQAKLANIPFIAEAFLDRRYNPNGSLVSRQVAGSVIQDPEMVVEQFSQILHQGKCQSLDGKDVSIHAQSYCVHGDNPNAVKILTALQQFCQQQNIKLARHED